jgi:pimeloyl-ACP methyl ester carboxylesterase
MAQSIVMIHGMWGGPWNWENFKPFFAAKGYQCHTPALRHHDVDPKDEPHPGLGNTSLLDYAMDLEAYIRALEEKPFLMGHSMGGLLAQILGARGLGEALVLLTPASPSGINALKFSVIRSFWSVLTKWGFWRNPHRLSFEAAVYAMLHLLPEEEQKIAYEKLVYESGLAATEIGFWLFDSKGAARVDESRITCPVLVVSGSEDRITPSAIGKKITDKYGSVATYKEFENHAHWVLGEPGWEEIAEFVSDWLNEIKK